MPVSVLELCLNQLNTALKKKNFEHWTVSYDVAFYRSMVPLVNAYIGIIDV